MPDLADLSATDLVASFRAGRASPVEALDAAVARIERHDPALNAFCHLDLDAARGAARASEERWRRQEPCGLLDGVPTTVKDTVAARGWPFRRGSRATPADDIPAEDAPSVERLRRHGAVLLGKTNTPEFGWKGVTDSVLFGITRNPWNPDLTPGGSSGGAAVALATGMCALALGTDGGGSIRIPASFTNLVGFKATFGTVPLAPPSPFGSLANNCPMARNVADAALMLTALRGPDIRDWESLPDDRTDFAAGLEQAARDLRGVRIAYSPNLGYARVDPDVAACVARAAADFAALGAEVEQVDAPFPDPTPIFRYFWCAGAAFALKAFSPTQRALLEEGLRRTGAEGERLALLDYLGAVVDRQAFAQAMTALHQRHDLLLTPTVAVAPFAVGHLVPPHWESDDWAHWTPFTYPFNLSRQPAISVPCGFTPAGLPVGAQIVGALRADPLVLRAAHAYAGAHPWFERRPPVLAAS